MSLNGVLHILFKQGHSGRIRGTVQQRRHIIVVILQHKVEALRALWNVSCNCSRPYWGGRWWGWTGQGFSLIRNYDKKSHL